MGWCRLKLAGVEHCGLCGIAHFGQGRTCPHLNSESQVATLLGTLKESTESRELVEMAMKYLRSIRGGLIQKKRDQEKRNMEMQQQRQRQQQSWNGNNGGAYQQHYPIGMQQQIPPPLSYPVLNRAASTAPQYP